MSKKVKVFMIKPFGYENYVVVENFDDFVKVLKNVPVGIDFMIRYEEMTQEELQTLEPFEGFESSFEESAE